LEDKGKDGKTKVNCKLKEIVITGLKCHLNFVISSFKLRDLSEENNTNFLCSQGRYNRRASRGANTLGFPNTKELLQNYPPFGPVPSKVFDSPVLGRKSFKE